MLRFGKVNGLFLMLGVLARGEFGLYGYSFLTDKLREVLSLAPNESPAETACDLMAKAGLVVLALMDGDRDSAISFLADLKAAVDNLADDLTRDEQA